MALGAGRGMYTPPAPVVALRRKLALVAAIWANPGDAVLIPDDFQPDASSLFFCEAQTKKLQLLRLSDICNRDFIPDPWGWNPSLRNALRRAGLRAPLPDDNYLSILRRLAHRRISREFIQKWNEFRPEESIAVPWECCSVDEFEEAWRRMGNLFVKAPYSSAGRGILRTQSSSPDAVRRWAKGCIRRHGSVMAEMEMPRSLDFATEWGCRRGEAHFLGWSVFSVSPDGRYVSNNASPQNELKALISVNVRIRVDEIVHIQKRILDNLIAPDYHGLLGIDMLAMPSGAINPCVEINLRRTMGHLPLLQRL